MVDIKALEQLLTQGQDSALLRFSLGNAHLAVGHYKQAATHLHEAVKQDPDYSAAWKLLGKALTEQGALEEALQIYTHGIEVATRRGDKQAEKEMQVFKKRLQKQLSDA